MKPVVVMPLTTWNDLQPSKEPEFLFYTGVVVIATALICAHLLWEGVYTSFWDALRFSSFQVVSVITTTGFITADYAQWHTSRSSCCSR